MSFSSGAYFGSHSTVSQFLGGQSGPRGFAGMDRTVIEHQDDRFVLSRRVRPIARFKTTEEGDEIAAALGGAGVDDQLAGGAIKGADHRPLLGLPRCLDPQIAAAFGPGPGEIGMGECLRFVTEQQGDVAGLGLLLQQAQAQARAVDRVGILPALQRVARPAPGKSPFFSTTLSRDFEMRSPVCFSISLARRGRVQFGRSETPDVSRSSTTDNAARAFFGSGPGALRARRPATPSRPKIQRQCRTLSGCTQNAAAIRSLVHPSNDNRMARARSASSRSRDPARPRNSALCSDVDSIHDCPDMISPHAVAPPWGFCHMWMGHENPA
jgi:hypothetical protein